MKIIAMEQLGIKLLIRQVIYVLFMLFMLLFYIFLMSSKSKYT